MTYGVGIVVGGVFAALSLVHVYWALGGTVGLESAIPRIPSTRGAHAIDRVPASDGALVRAFHPSAAMTLAVAGALGMVAVLLCLRAGLFAPARVHGWLRASLAALAVILLARAVGDLKLVGFFKRIKGTRFAELDTWLYAPLCVLLALGLVLLVSTTPCRA